MFRKLLPYLPTWMLVLVLNILVLWATRESTFVKTERI